MVNSVISMLSALQARPGSSWLRGMFVAAILLPMPAWADASDSTDEPPSASVPATSSEAEETDEPTVDLETVLSEALPDDAYGADGDRCLANHRYRNIEIISDQYLLVRGSHGRAWVNELPRRCPGLRRDSVLVTESRVGRICKSDMFRAMDRVDFGGPSIAHAVCAFGVFQPVAADQIDLIREAIIAKSRTTTVKATAKGGK